MLIIGCTHSPNNVTLSTNTQSPKNDALQAREEEGLFAPFQSLKAYNYLIGCL